MITYIKSANSYDNLVLPQICIWGTGVGKFQYTTCQLRMTAQESLNRVANSLHLLNNTILTSPVVQNSSIARYHLEYQVLINK